MSQWLVGMVLDMTRWQFGPGQFVMCILLSCVVGCGAGIKRELYRNEIAYLQTEGNKLYAAGDLLVAESKYHAILDIDETDAVAWASLGNVALARGAYHSAKEYYEQALLADPSMRGMVEPYMAHAGLQQTPPPPGPNLEAMIMAVRSVTESGALPDLYEHYLKIIEIGAWVDYYRSSPEPDIRSFSELLNMLIGRDDTPSGIRDLAACWLVMYGEAELLPMFRTILIDSRDESVRSYLAVNLGLAYERAGRRADAIDVYLLAAESSVVRGRLHELSR